MMDRIQAVTRSCSSWNAMKLDAGALVPAPTRPSTHTLGLSIPSGLAQGDHHRIQTVVDGSSALNTRKTLINLPVDGGDG